MIVFVCALVSVCVRVYCVFVCILNIIVRKKGTCFTKSKLIYDYLRSAYLKLTKEFHPDHNVGKSRQETERIHNKVSTTF